MLCIDSLFTALMSNKINILDSNSIFYLDMSNKANILDIDSLIHRDMSKKISIPYLGSSIPVRVVSIRVRSVSIHGLPVLLAITAILFPKSKSYRHSYKHFVISHEKEPTLYYPTQSEISIIIFNR